MLLNAQQPPWNGPRVFGHYCCNASWWAKPRKYVTLRVKVTVLRTCELVPKVYRQKFRRGEKHRTKWQGGGREEDSEAFKGEVEWGKWFQRRWSCCFSARETMTSFHPLLSLFFLVLLFFIFLFNIHGNAQPDRKHANLHMHGIYF